MENKTKLTDVTSAEMDDIQSLPFDIGDYINKIYQILSSAEKMAREIEVFESNSIIEREDKSGPNNLDGDVEMLEAGDMDGYVFKKKDTVFESAVRTGNIINSTDPRNRRYLCEYLRDMDDMIERFETLSTDIFDYLTDFNQMIEEDEIPHKSKKDKSRDVRVMNMVERFHKSFVASVSVIKTSSGKYRGICDTFFAKRLPKAEEEEMEFQLWEKERELEKESVKNTQEYYLTRGPRSMPNGWKEYLIFVRYLFDIVKTIENEIKHSKKMGSKKRMNMKIVCEGYRDIDYLITRFNELMVAFRELVDVSDYQDSIEMSWMSLDIKSTMDRLDKKFRRTVKAIRPSLGNNREMCHEFFIDFRREELMEINMRYASIVAILKGQQGEERCPMEDRKVVTRKSDREYFRDYDRVKEISTAINEELFSGNNTQPKVTLKYDRLIGILEETRSVMEEAKSLVEFRCEEYMIEDLGELASTKSVPNNAYKPCVDMKECENNLYILRFWNLIVRMRNLKKGGSMDKLNMDMREYIKTLITNQGLEKSIAAKVRQVQGGTSRMLKIMKDQASIRRKRGNKGEITIDSVGKISGRLQPIRAARKDNTKKPRTGEGGASSSADLEPAERIEKLFKDGGLGEEFDNYPCHNVQECNLSIRRAILESTVPFDKDEFRDFYHSIGAKYTHDNDGNTAIELTGPFADGSTVINKVAGNISNTFRELSTLRAQYKTADANEKRMEKALRRGFASFDRENDGGSVTTKKNDDDSDDDSDDDDEDERHDVKSPASPMIA